MRMKKYFFSYDEDEFGNLDFTEQPKNNYQSGIKQNYNSARPTYNTKRPTTNYHTKTPSRTTTRFRHYSKKDPIRTTMEHFMNLGRYRNSGTTKPKNKDIHGYKPKNEVIHGFDKNGVWKKYSIYEYSTPTPKRPSYSYSSNEELRKLQNSAGKKFI